MLAPRRCLPLAWGLLLFLPAAVRAGALRECGRGCRIVQSGCVEDMQGAYASADRTCRTGHPFGEHLTDAQRHAVIEYLKTP